MNTAALIGNPNVGKTTLFNLLTGSKQYVGNWAGVTVDKKEGFFNKTLRIVDLPGIYAMDTFSNEEKVSKNFLLEGNADLIINIIDAANLSRNLYLTTQLKQFNIPILLVINMIDVLDDKGIKINYDTLSKELGVIAIPISASKNIGVDKLHEVLLNRNLTVPKKELPHFHNERETYEYIDNILSKTISHTGISKNTSDRIDKFILNKFLSYPLFFAILFLIFKFTFNWVGQPLSNLLRTILNNGIMPALNTMLSNSSGWFRSLLVDGIVNGVGSVLVFLPIILSLFICISFLEDSGYMARAAFIMDKLMRKIGLSGKAFIPLLVGFGCSVPAIMSTKTLESEKDRKLTALLIPLMSCNARLPVYALIASAFFPGSQTLVVFSLYLLGILMAFIIGLILKNTLFKREEEPFLIELPEYKMPEFKNIMLHTWDKCKGFLKKAGTIIFSASVVIWFLSNFNFNGMTHLDNSFLAQIGMFITPVFKPIGLGSWKICVSLLTGFMAKEVIVSTLGVLYGSNLQTILPLYFTPLSAYSFLVFILLYTPCISTISIIRKEYGRKMAVFAIVYEVTLAWITAFLIFNIGNLIF